MFEEIFCKGSADCIAFVFNLLVHLGFFAQLQKIMIKDFGGVIGTVKLCCEELGQRNLTVKNWLSFLYSFVPAQC